MQCLSSVADFLCCNSKPRFLDPYDFTFTSESNSPENEKFFESNFVRTSRYTWYDFLPKSLLLQFKRLANIYFLIISILQSISIISPLGPLTAWAPLIVVLGISILREGYEDYQRYKSDRQVNFELKTEVRRNGEYLQVEWSKLIVGDVVRVNQKNPVFPADLILISSSSEGGNAFIETASLDGEKNLKIRNAHSLTQEYGDPLKLPTFSGVFHGILPDKSLVEFTSKMTLHKSSTESVEVVYKTNDQLLFRGAKLRNTKWIIGLVIYTGKNSKIMMNSGETMPKMSQIEVKVNNILGLILILQLTMCLLIAILYGNFRSNSEVANWYIDWTTYSIVADSVLIFFGYFVLLNTMIPISLIVSIEIVKMSQSYFIDHDQFMYSSFRKVNAQVKSASLNEELGQIEYIFSDKTGTLTMNLMEFKIAVIGKKMYGDLGLIINNPLRPPQQEKGFKDEQLTSMLRDGKESREDSFAPIVVKGGGQSVTFSSIKQLAEEYFIILALTHKVMVDLSDTGVESYQGPSPDDIALVETAKIMDFQFVRATQATTELKIRRIKKEYPLLQSFPFTSDRKRGSVIIRDGNVIKLYMKGADSIMMGRVAKDQNLNLDQELNTFSRIGLRTLLVGMRTISEDEYRNFVRDVSALAVDASPHLYEELVSKLETGIYLIGATAVLDRLQEDVPETIRDLIRAKIKVWMLTGDKMETAENIAKSCKLFQPDFEILRYQFHSRQTAAEYLRELTKKAIDLQSKKKTKGMIIEDRSLAAIISYEDNQIEFANLSKYCDAVVCCRMAPIQKAEVVRIVKERLKKITLSIGDGANDVPMIKTAHIGVGLFGEEGFGAVQASDYALPQFRMLWRLLLVHGRWNYIRIGEMVLYFFYKNMLYTIPHFVFAFYNGFSGQTIFDDNYISLYNLLFTAFPLIVRAVLEQDVNYVVASKGYQEVKREPLPEGDVERLENVRQTMAQHESLQEIHDSKRKALPPRIPHLMQSRSSKYIPRSYELNKYMYKLFPRIYYIGQENCIYNVTNFSLWVLEGMVEAVLMTLFCLYILSSASISQSGFSSDLWMASLTIYSTIIMVVTFKLSTHTKFWSPVLFFSILVLSIGTYVAYMWISNFYFSTYVLGTAYMSWTTGETYLIVLFCSLLVIALDGYIIAIDFRRGGYASKMRTIIDAEAEADINAYNQLSVKIEETEKKSDINKISPRGL